MPNPPKPTHLKLLEGNRGHRPINKDEPMPKGDLLEPPEHLSASQKDGWRYAIKHAPEGLLKLLDESVFEVWVVAQDLHRDASARVAKHGSIVKTANGNWIQNPYLCIVNKQAFIMMKAANELGFTPVARTRIRIEAGKREANPFDDLKRFDGD